MTCAPQTRADNNLTRPTKMRPIIRKAMVTVALGLIAFGVARSLMLYSEFGKQCRESGGSPMRHSRG